MTYATVCCPLSIICSQGPVAFSTKPVCFHHAALWQSLKNPNNVAAVTRPCDNHSKDPVLVRYAILLNFKRRTHFSIHFRRSQCVALVAKFWPILSHFVALCRMFHSSIWTIFAVFFKFSTKFQLNFGQIRQYKSGKSNFSFSSLFFLPF